MGNKLDFGTKNIAKIKKHLFDAKDNSKSKHQLVAVFKTNVPKCPLCRTKMYG